MSMMQRQWQRRLYNQMSMKLISDVIPKHFYEYKLQCSKIRKLPQKILSDNKQAIVSTASSGTAVSYTRKYF